MASELRVCSICGAAKPRSEYYQSSGYRDGLYRCCKLCHREKVRTRINKQGPRDRRIERIASMYRIPRGTATALVDQHHCQICRVESDRLEIDHCHETGNVRGALCRRCNKGIAFFDADPAWLIKATAYVWPLPVAETRAPVDITPGATQPGLWADERVDNDLSVSHGEWSS